MKMIQVKTQAEAIAEILAYGSPVSGCNHTIVETDNGGFTVLINHPETLEIESEGEPCTYTYTYDDVALVISEAIADRTLNFAPVKTGIDIMLNR